MNPGINLPTTTKKKTNLKPCVYLIDSLHLTQIKNISLPNLILNCHQKLIFFS